MHVSVLFKMTRIRRVTVLVIIKNCEIIVVRIVLVIMEPCGMAYSKATSYRHTKWSYSFFAAEAPNARLGKPYYVLYIYIYIHYGNLNTKLYIPDIVLRNSGSETRAVRVQVRMAFPV